MSNVIPVAKPWMDEAEADAAKRAILSGWVTQGPEVAAFESEFASLVKTPHACAVSSCTTALHLALRAAGVGEGDEVITPSYSYIATANSIRYCGAIPVFVDIEQDGPNIDPGLAEQSITPKTKAILCVHQMGMPCDVYRLAEIASRHRLALIEDAACAIGSSLRTPDGEWQLIGAPIGDIACFSFHPRKVITTGDGGMLTTRDAGMDRRFRIERQHGMDVPDLARHTSSRVIDDTHVSLGYNYRMTDVQAAIGRVQLTRLGMLVDKRRAAATRYVEMFAGSRISTPRVPDGVMTNWQTFWVELPEDADRAAVMQTLLDDGISTRRGVHCAHREPAYSHEPWRMGSGGLSRSERLQDRSLVLPLFHDITEADQDKVADRLKKAVQ